MATLLTACPDKGSKNGAAPVATAPPATPSQACHYDWRDGRYRWEDGNYCSYDDWYDPNACYNYYYNPYYDRYYDKSGSPMDSCTNNTYDNNGLVVPYQNWYGGYANTGYIYYYNTCPLGYTAINFGGGIYNCVLVNPPSNYLNFYWHVWLNF
ncbi:MAG: hypothetical protein KDD34_02675 [Bdellovibrionales bacterium]|nr:hypothetical protein [Bdellovibrionales bacterium]